MEKNLPRDIRIWKTCIHFYEYDPFPVFKDISDELNSNI